METKSKGCWETLNLRSLAWKLSNHFPCISFAFPSCISSCQRHWFFPCFLYSWFSVKERTQCSPCYLSASNLIDKLLRYCRKKFTIKAGCYYYYYYQRECWRSLHPSQTITFHSLDAREYAATLANQSFCLNKCNNFWITASHRCSCNGVESSMCHWSLDLGFMRGPLVSIYQNPRGDCITKPARNDVPNDQKEKDEKKKRKVR